MAFLARDWGYREGMTCLSPTPLYHGSPQSATGIAIRFGATVIVMRKFDAVQFLALIERYRVTHVQMVPTMFNRLLALPREVRDRYDVSSLEAVVHAAAPCSIPTKEQMIEWWGPIIHEYYAATESIGYTSCTSAEWLAHPGTVGTAKLGEIHILDNDLNECQPGVPGKVFFRPPRPLRYWNDADKSKSASTADGSMSTVGDIGYLDEEGWLYLTDRESFMIISGGVNIYPQETENVLLTHPAIADAAVFGIPNPDLGEEVKAVVELRPGIVASEDLIEEILTYCRSRLARHKCPKSIDIATTLPRHDTGKLFKHELRKPYWLGRESRI
jgi:long-chain acyl-CoA synthetase